MSNEDHSHPISQGGKFSKNALKKESEKNETFYVKKRGLFRKAEQVVKYCNSEVFIIVHKKDSDKIFSFTSDKTFNLEKISTLVLRDVQQSAILQKNKKFQTEDFDKIMSNIKQIQQINAQADPNETLPHDKMQKLNDEYLLQGRNGAEPETLTETMTEDMSMSMQMQFQTSAKKNGIQPRGQANRPAQMAQMRDNTPEMYTSPKASELQKYNQQFRKNSKESHDNIPATVNPKQSVISSIQPIPLNKQQNKQKFESPVFKQDDMNLQLNNYNNAAPFHQQYPPHQQSSEFHQQHLQGRQDLTPRSQVFQRQKAAQNIPPSQGYGNNNFYQQPYPQQPQYPNQFINRPAQHKGQLQQQNDSLDNGYPDHDKSKHGSKVSVDIHKYNKEKFDCLMAENKMQDDNDDIFLCYDRDEIDGLGGDGYNKYQQPGQMRSGVEQQPGTSGISIGGKRMVINPPNKPQFSGVSMQSKFPSMVGQPGMNHNSQSQQFFKSQVQNPPEANNMNHMQKSGQFFKNNVVQKVPPVKLEPREAREFHQPNNIMSPTSHFDDQNTITSPRDRPSVLAPQGMPIGGIGVRGRNAETRKSFRNKKHSQISNISVQRPNIKNSMGLASINNSQHMDEGSFQQKDNNQYKVTSGVLGHQRMPMTARDRDINMEMNDEEESFHQDFQHHRRDPNNQSGQYNQRQLSQINTARNPPAGDDFTPKLRTQTQYNEGHSRRMNTSNVVNVSGTQSRGNSQISNQAFNNSGRRKTSNSGSGSGVRSIRSGLIKPKNQINPNQNQQQLHNSQFNGSRQGSGSRINDPQQFNNNDFYR